MAIIAQMRVLRTNKISTVARILFFSPNWIGVNIKLKIRLRINGKMTIKGIFLCKNSRKALPKERIIRPYKIVHTGLKIHDGGAQEGLINIWYQL